MYTPKGSASKRPFMHRPVRIGCGARSRCFAEGTSPCHQRGLHSCKGRGGQVEGSRGQCREEGDSSLTLKLPSPAQPGSGGTQENLCLCQFPQLLGLTWNPQCGCCPRQRATSSFKPPSYPQGKQPGGDSSIDSAPLLSSGSGRPLLGTVAIRPSNEAHPWALVSPPAHTAGVPALSWLGEAQASSSKLQAVE